MRLDTLGLETQKFYWHHYNFPPFSVGEAGFMRGPKRRDIGHGALAERALVPVVPNTEDFPYTIRVVSDILESNGSSSMASVCGSSLALMDAGVPIRKPVAGIAMGLIKEGDDYTVLTDIAGVEDHLGDMDFKVAGTDEGITALQMDIKITGVTFDILRDALSQAREARLNILGQMAEVIGQARAELSPHAPRIITVQIDPSKIGLLIGKGGETIRGLSDEFESQIDVNDEGQVLVYSSNGELGEQLAERIRTMTKEVEVGDSFSGKVVKTTTFGAFVELAKGTDGLLHISNVSPGQRVDTVEDVLNKGDEIQVRVVEVDRERGRIGLRLAEDPDVAGKTADELATVGGGGGGGGDRGPRRERSGRRPRAQRRRPRLRPPASPPGRRRRARPRAWLAAPTNIRSRPRSPRIPWRRGGPPAHHARRRPAGRHRAHGLGPLRRPRRLDRDRLGRRVRAPGGAQPPDRAHALPRHRPLRVAGDRPALRRDGRRAQRRHRQGDHARSSPACWTVTSTAPWTSWPTWSGARSSIASDLDAEREIVIEEIAMYDDDPQDKVFDVLGEAVFGTHPLGRAIIGTAEVVGSVDSGALHDFHAERYVPSNVVVVGRGLGRPRRARRDGPPRRRRAQRRDRAAGARRAGAPGAAPSASSPRTPSSTTCASARPASPATTTAASRCACSTTCSAARRPRGCSRRCARSAAWPTRVYSFQSLYAGTGQIGLYLGTRPDNVEHGAAASSATSSSASAPTRPRADELERAKENVKGRVRARARVDRGAHEPAGLLGARRDAAAERRRGRSRASTP